MTNWGWLAILVLLIACVWLSMALLDTRAQLRDYRRHVNRLLRDADRGYQSARLGSIQAQRERRLTGGGEAS